MRGTGRLLLLTSAVVIGLSAQAAQRPASSPPIAQARIAEINSYTCRHGAQFEMGAGVTAPMGLTQPGVPYRARRSIIRDGSRTHYWSIHHPMRDRVHIFVIEGRQADAWVIDLRGNLLSAGQIRDGRFQLIPATEARASFEAEMAMWADTEIETRNSAGRAEDCP